MSGMAVSLIDGGARRWMLATTHWRQEKLALENIGRQRGRDGGPLFEAYLPMQHKMVTPRGQPPRVLSLPFFPRYLFVNVDVGAPGWTALYSTRGVSGVLPCGAKGSDALGRLVGDLREREVEGLLQLTPGHLPCPWQAGDRVTYGAFRDAMFIERVDERRARILVSLFQGVDSAVEADLSGITDSAGIESRVVR